VEGPEEGTQREVEFFTWERTDRAAELADTAHRLAGVAKHARR
jgi:hypothetical protein